MATHSSTLAWKIPWTEESGRLQSMGLQSHTLLSDLAHKQAQNQQSVNHKNTSPVPDFSHKLGDRNGRDLTEAEDIKKRWQEYTEELYKKDFHDPDNHDGVITHLEPDIRECDVKWDLGSIITELVEVMEFQLSYFKS